MRTRYSNGIVIILILFFAIDGVMAQAKFSNKIYGKIVDSETGKPLFNVNVFLSNTTRGAASGPDGSYAIENIPPGSYQLIVSMIGYELLKIPVHFIKQKTFHKDIRLVPKILPGEEVEIIAEEPKEWKKNLNRFYVYFIGETENARKCKILNPEVLDFKINPDTGEFVAFTDSMLTIDNEALGYRLRIILEQFRFCHDSLYLVIYPLYSELPSNDEKQKDKWQKRRKETYEGSFRHFLSALARGKVQQEYFELYRRGGDLVTAEELNIIHNDTSAVLK